MERNIRFWMMGILAASLLLAGCNDDDENGPSEMANQKSYALSQLDDSGVSGTVTFSRQNDSTTRVIISLTGTAAGNSHPAHIHANTADVGGPIVLDFNPVDGATGRSETDVTAFNDGTPVTYEELVAYDGHVNVHKSVDELAMMIAQGNIGSNATGTASGAVDDGTNGDGGY